MLCGGRGTLRPTLPGIDRAVVFEELRDIGEPRLRAFDAARDETAGGVIWLTVGRENELAEGRALVVRPSVFARDGLTFTWLSDCAPFKSFEPTRIEFECTGKPRCMVLCETAVNPPGLLAFTK